tara:strand:+ start:178 stop:1308 length:1131 start_codon:yes stop_codon:yes gene_type:complete
MTLSYDVIIVGGGLAGLVSALNLSMKGRKVLLIEKHAYPKHKVCGEYISREVLPYLYSLDFDPYKFGAKDIQKITLSTASNISVSTDLPLGGFSISRYCIDYELKKKAELNGARVLKAKVSEIDFHNELFSVKTSSNDVYIAPLVIGAFGKRSNMDMKLNRPFLLQHAPFMAVKAHYSGAFPDDSVGLHNFEGGYCGISKIENNHINICYLTEAKIFNKYKNIQEFQEKVLYKNKFLKEVITNSKLVFDQPLAIGNVSFSSKNLVEDHMLMCGDSAGMIHPLAGNGMGMAIRSAQMVSKLILAYSQGEIKSREKLEGAYTKSWKNEFGLRLKSSHIIARLFRLGIIADLMMLFIKVFPFTLPYIIIKTHGTPIREE